MTTTPREATPAPRRSRSVLGPAMDAVIRVEQAKAERRARVEQGARRAPGS